MWVRVDDAVRLTAVLIGAADLSRVHVELAAGELLGAKRLSDGSLVERAAGPRAQHDAVQALGGVQRVRHLRDASVGVRAAAEAQETRVVGEQVAGDDVVQPQRRAPADNTDRHGGTGQQTPAEPRTIDASNIHDTENQDKTT